LVSGKTDVWQVWHTINFALSIEHCWIFKAITFSLSISLFLEFLGYSLSLGTICNDTTAVTCDSIFTMPLHLLNHRELCWKQNSAVEKLLLSILCACTSFGVCHICEIFLYVCMNSDVRITLKTTHA
jgi:hypothetical protein